jgi:hypothetical protein
LAQIHAFAEALAQTGELMTTLVLLGIEELAWIMGQGGTPVSPISQFDGVAALVPTAD